ncbi:type IX secretion system membrane protein, PorP/SprF family [Polaribacter sp. KT25b]|uniref:PorP/SprF family type IX secretion system membrane protein n=1 Tax=Polaribacter sp. KT25b TaxID=1855336 RepID=UPI00087B467C|nr:type IX secretion system membrane protein PorP/SprF [Polaribacter sp. KT25b]SDS08745.1 type IX secretion system membrane protein, PorP/SprF family [Polaribacter sp. KT25b]
MIRTKNQIIFKIKNSKKYWLKASTALLIGFLSLQMNAQQLPNYTQYLYNMQIINPAYVGARADLSMSLLSREQWVGLKGAPITRTFSINGRTSNGLGFGTTVVNDKIGLSESTNVNIDASYTIITSQFGRVSFGLKGGMTFFNNNLANGITPDNDVYASTSGNYPNVGFGAFFFNKKFYVGLSVPYILESPQFYIEENVDKTSLTSNANYFFSTGALFKLTENVMFKPSTMVRYASNLPVSIDINSNFLYKEIIEAGLSYRHENSMSALFALIIKKKYRIGYAYDHKFSILGGNLSSHEIIFHLDLDLRRNYRWLLHNKCYF